MRMATVALLHPYFWTACSGCSGLATSGQHALDHTDNIVCWCGLVDGLRLKQAYELLEATRGGL